MRIRVMTWNIHKGIGMDRRFRPERLVEVIQHYEPDVLLLQEVDRGVGRSRHLDLDEWIADEAGFPYFVWTETHRLKEGSYGNATLSKRPIRRKRAFDLTIGKRKRRAALYTRIDLAGHYKDLHVFNWHLGLSAMERQQQAARLLRSGTLRGLGRRARVILGGDTNDWRNLLFLYGKLKHDGFHAWSEHGRRQHIFTYPSPAPVGALDKLFWRGPFGLPHVFASRMKLARIASDHLPLIGDFDLV